MLYYTDVHMFTYIHIPYDLFKNDEFDDDCNDTKEDLTGIKLPLLLESDIYNIISTNYGATCFPATFFSYTKRPC